MGLVGIDYRPVAGVSGNHRSDSRNRLRYHQAVMLGRDALVALEFLDRVQRAWYCTKCSRRGAGLEGIRIDPESRQGKGDDRWQWRLGLSVPKTCWRCSSS